MPTYTEHAGRRIEALREAAIILPVNPGASLGGSQGAHTLLQNALINLAGGFTVTAGQGAWRDLATGQIDAEAVKVYTFAVSEAVTFAAITEVAAYACLRHKQAAIYVRYPDGVANVIDRETCIAILGEHAAAEYRREPWRKAFDDAKPRYVEDRLDKGLRDAEERAFRRGNED